MRLLIAMLFVCLFAAAAPASAHMSHRATPGRILAPGLMRVPASMPRVKHSVHERHHLAPRRTGHRYAVHRMRKFAQPRMGAAFVAFEPGPFSMMYGAAQTVIDTGVAAVGVGTSIAVHAGASVAGGMYAGASAVVDQVRQAAAAAGVPESIALAVARFESRFNENERGRAGEIGDMQVLPRTARAMGCTNLRDHSCIRAAGMRYLALALQQPGSMCEKLSAYNHGLGYRSCTSYGRNIERLAGLR